MLRNSRSCPLVKKTTCFFFFAFVSDKIFTLTMRRSVVPVFAFILSESGVLRLSTPRLFPHWGWSAAAFCSGEKSSDPTYSPCPPLLYLRPWCLICLPLVRASVKTGSDQTHSRRFLLVPLVFFCIYLKKGNYHTGVPSVIHERRTYTCISLLRSFTIYLFYWAHLALDSPAALKVYHEVT